MLKTDVYQRYGVDTISRGTFYLLVGVVLSWGFLATYFASGLTQTWTPNIWLFLLIGLGLPILGIFMSASDNPILSFLGFNLVAIPFGAILGPVLHMYELSEPGIVGEAALLTGCVTAVMAASGFAFPNFYRSIGGALFGALLGLLGVLIASLFIPSLADLTIIHYGAAGLFSLYIGYDMWRASEIPATVDNAVDVSVSLYLDIINLFLWILRILGSKSD